MVIYKGVNFYPRQVEQILLRQSGVSHEYQIVLDAHAGGERMTVHVEVDDSVGEPATARIRRELQAAQPLARAPPVPGGRAGAPAGKERAGRRPPPEVSPSTGGAG